MEKLLSVSSLVAVLGLGTYVVTAQPTKEIRPASLSENDIAVTALAKMSPTLQSVTCCRKQAQDAGTKAWSTRWLCDAGAGDSAVEPWLVSWLNKQTQGIADAQCLTVPFADLGAAGIKADRNVLTGAPIARAPSVDELMSPEEPKPVEALGEKVAP